AVSRAKKHGQTWFTLKDEEGLECKWKLRYYPPGTKPMHEYSYLKHDKREWLTFTRASRHQHEDYERYFVYCQEWDRNDKRYAKRMTFSKEELADMLCRHESLHGRVMYDDNDEDQVDTAG